MTRICVLSDVQSRILLSLLMEGQLCSTGITTSVGISGSSWSKEKRLLISSGLVDCLTSKVMTDRGVVRRMDFKLTRRGKEVAQNLLAISETINEEEQVIRASQTIPNTADVISQKVSG